MSTAGKGASQHISVMMNEVVEYLKAAEQGGSYLDCTLGGGGHTCAILQANSENTVVAIDRDESAIARMQARMTEDQSGRLELLYGSFGAANHLLAEAHPGDVPEFKGILADLGLSTDQIKEGRGFSFSDSDTLDMRMDKAQSVSAAEIVNEASEQELFIILKKGGVGKDARRIARAILAARPLESAARLAEVISSASSRETRAKKVHPATVPFQALRIEVNQELHEIESLLSVSPDLVVRNGRMAVISFHSIEDKLVTKTMRSWEGESAPANWAGPVTSKPSLGRLITRKAVVPQAEEIKRNPAARSARLRVFEFCKER